MRRILFIGFLWFFSSVFLYSQDPQRIINSLDTQLTDINAATLDSIKNDLLSRYILDFRVLGKENAIDSLNTRINRILKKDTPAVFATNTLATTTRKKESGNNLLSGNTKQDTQDTSIRKIIDHTLFISDSVTYAMIVNKSVPLLEPVYFDSFSHTDFFNYFNIPEVSFRKEVPELFKVNENLIHGEEQLLFRNKLRRRTINYISVSRPELIGSYNISHYNDFSKDIEKAREKELTLNVDQYLLNPIIGSTTDDLLKPKGKGPWSSNGKLSVQFSQYYVTKNWYKGGDPNASLLSIFEYYKNYNNNKLTWDNNLDVKIGFFNSGNDTLRAFRVNNDVFRINSRLGYQSFIDKWYYSINGELNTSMFTSYAGTNSNEVVTAFLSPTRIFMSLGMDYRFNANTSILIAPAAYKLIFLTSDMIDPLTVGIEKGKSSNSVGYLVQAKINWKFTKEISVASDFHLFSTYDFKNVEFNWETTANFIINRYLSTRLSLNMRFDNTPKKTTRSEKNKLQIQEQLSFGFHFRF
jgi:hypothetical protein